ncbi:Proline--tRNA ligase, partial [Dissostichus eleginoides]
YRGPELQTACANEYAISPLTEQCVTAAEVHGAKSTTVICDDKRPGLVFILQRSREA